MKRRTKVLFLCTGNSCRSQMAEAWARHLRNSDIEAFSAGTAPHGIDPIAVKVMSEADVDMSGQKSKHLDELAGVDIDLVITVCDRANAQCPVFPGKVRKIHAGFDDPPALARGAANEAEVLSHYRRVRDEIRRFVESLHV